MATNLNSFYMLFTNYFLSTVCTICKHVSFGIMYQNAVACSRYVYIQLEKVYRKWFTIVTGDGTKARKTIYIIVMTVSNYFQFIECGYDIFGWQWFQHSKCKYSNRHISHIEVFIIFYFWQVTCSPLQMYVCVRL